MKCDIYIIKETRDTFLVVPNQLQPKKALLLTKYQPQDLIHLGIQEISSESMILGVNANEIKESIAENGYYIGKLVVEKPNYSAASTLASTGIGSAAANTAVGSALGGGLMLGSLLSALPLIGPIGLISGAIVGLLVAAKAKEDKNEPKP